MSNFNKVVLDKIRVRSVMLLHEGGTKFYEVMLIERVDTANNESISINRWGRIESKDWLGTLSKAKTLSNHASHYIEGIVSNKLKRGYVEEDFSRVTLAGTIALNKLRSINFEDYLDDITNQDTYEARNFFRLAGYDRNMPSPPSEEEIFRLAGYDRNMPSPPSEEEIEEAAKDNFSDEEFDVVVITKEQRSEAFGSW